MIRVTIEKENDFVVQACVDETSREAKEQNVDEFISEALFEALMMASRHTLCPSRVLANAVAYIAEGCTPNHYWSERHAAYDRMVDACVAYAETFEKKQPNKE